MQLFICLVFALPQGEVSTCVSIAFVLYLAYIPSMHRKRESAVAITAASLAAKQRILSAYAVSPDEQKEVLSLIQTLDIRGLCEQVMQELFRNLAMRFSFSLGNS